MIGILRMGAPGHRLALLLLFTLTPLSLPARSVGELSELARAATFEVVLPKIEPDHVTYEKPLPLELLSFTERNDQFWSIGTAFAIAPELFVSNAHVLLSAMGSPLGHPHLRDVSGATFEIDRILKFSLHEDYVVFSARGAKAAQALSPGTQPAIGASVYAVGNALGEGVVVRDGLLTSLTPEDQDGRWKWLRFSAAASPGNSGGPLLDDEGRVLGVVTAKSEGENLNYALPIERVLQGSEREGIIDVRSSFSLPILRHQMVTHFKGSLPLPVSWEKFVSLLLQMEQQEYEQNQVRLLKQHDADLPPGGQSATLLATLEMESRFGLIGQQSDDSWGLTDPVDSEDIRLSDGETLSIGSLGGVLAFRWWREDTGANAAPVRDGKAFMDGLLKGLKLPRVFGPQAIRVTSLGAPLQESLHTDRFDRRWQQRSWSLGYTDLQIITLTLPTPDGNVGLMRFTTASGTASTISSLRLLADYAHVTYEGSARQWKDFVADSRLCPPFLRGVRFDQDTGTQMALVGMEVTIPPTVLPLDEQSQLTLYTGYQAGKGRLVARLAGLTIQQDRGDDASWIGVWAQSRPADEAGSELQKRWREMSERKTGFDGVPGHDPAHTSFWTISAIGDPDADLQFEVTLNLNEGSLLPRQVSARRDALHAGLKLTSESR